MVQRSIGEGWIIDAKTNRLCGKIQHFHFKLLIIYKILISINRLPNAVQQMNLLKKKSRNNYCLIISSIQEKPHLI